MGLKMFWIFGMLADITPKDNVLSLNVADASVPISVVTMLIFSFDLI